MSVSQGMPVAADRAPIGRTSYTMEWLQRALPKIVLAPSFAVILVVVYGFIVFTGVLSFTIQDPAVLQLGRLGELREAVGLRAGSRRCRSRDLRLALHPAMLGDRTVLAI
jgi:hypothetical protein